MQPLMILSKLYLRYKNKWWARREAELTLACAAQEADLRRELQERLDAVTSQQDAVTRQQDEVTRQQRDVEHLERTQRERKEALAKANEELHTQLRLLEAKAAPDQVWAEAFSHGFSKAWGMMQPLLLDGVKRLEEHIRTTAINETLANLATTHQLLAAKDITLRSQIELIKKREEFTLKAQATTGVEGEKYQHYLTALAWMTNGH